MQVEVEPETTTWISANQEDAPEDSPAARNRSPTSTSPNFTATKNPASGGGGESGNQNSGGDGESAAPPAPPRSRPTFWVPPRPGWRTARHAARRRLGARRRSRRSSMARQLLAAARWRGSRPPQLAAGVPVRVAPNALTAFSAGLDRRRRILGLLGPATTPRTRPVPHTRITMGPSSKTRGARSPSSASPTPPAAGPGTRFFCRFNKKGRVAQVQVADEDQAPAARASTSSASGRSTRPATATEAGQAPFQGRPRH